MTEPLLQSTSALSTSGAQSNGAAADPLQSRPRPAKSRWFKWFFDLFRSKEEKRERFTQRPKLVKTIRLGGWVSGVTQLGDIVYVVRRESPVIEMYSADTLSPLGEGIRVEGMKEPSDIVACPHDRHLYVGERVTISWDDGCIWRVSADDHTCVKWLTTDSTTDKFDVHTMSLTSRRLLVTSFHPRLRQYDTTSGQLIRVVQLPQYVRSVWHAIETTRGSFVVCHLGTLEDEPGISPHYTVSEVSVGGEVLTRYTDVTWPWYLSRDIGGHVMVADCLGRSILLMNSQLELQRVLVGSDSLVPECHPTRLCYNEVTSQLYIVQINTRKCEQSFTVIALFNVSR